MLEADVLTRLQQRQEQLVEVFLEETDPKNWPVSKDTKSRGDRYWEKKNGLATANLIVRIQNIMDQALRQPIATPEPTPGDDEDRVDTGAMAAEAIAEANKIIENAKGTRFGNRDGR